METQKYIVISFEEYQQMLDEMESLRRRKDAPMPDIDDLFFLSPRLYGHLNRKGIKNVAEIEETRVCEWTMIPGFGRKSLKELKDLMKMYGLQFKD